MIRGTYNNVEWAPIRNKKGHLSEVKGGTLIELEKVVGALCPFPLIEIE